MIQVQNPLIRHLSVSGVGTVAFERSENYENFSSKLHEVVNKAKIVFQNTKKNEIVARMDSSAKKLVENYNMYMTGLLEKVIPSLTEETQGRNGESLDYDGTLLNKIQSLTFTILDKANEAQSAVDAALQDKACVIQ